jgi:hypothetical protein
LSSLSISIALAVGGPLVIGDHPDDGTGLWLPENGLGRPSFSFRYKSAPESDVDPGRELLAYTENQDDLPFTVYAKAASSAALATLKASLDAALAGTGAITVTEDGVATVYADRWPAKAKWNDYDSGFANAYLASATCTVPVNP